MLEQLAIGIGHRQARDCHRLASQGMANPGWGAPRIHGVLLKLRLELSQATVAKYLVRHRRPPSQNWRAFLKNHMQSLVSANFFVVPTITFRLQFVFVILSHDRRRPIHLAVTANPTAEWATRRLLEAFPWDSTPLYLLRDRDACYGKGLSRSDRVARHSRASGGRWNASPNAGQPNVPGSLLSYT
jgi:hypothetical protein